MTLEQFVRIVLKGKDWNWLGRMTPDQLREAVGSMLSCITDLPPGATVDWVLTQAMAGKDEAPASVSDGKAELGIPPAAASQQIASAHRRRKRERARSCASSLPTARSRNRRLWPLLISPRFPSVR
jgi:hypothetical protein